MGRETGTKLEPQHAPVAARKRWLAGQLRVRGKLFLDPGACRVLTQQGRSLLPVGVQRVEGRFYARRYSRLRGWFGVADCEGIGQIGADECRRHSGEPQRANR